MSTENTKKCYLDIAGLSKYDELIKQYIAEKDLVITGTLVTGDYATIKALSDAIKSLEGTNHSHTNKTVLDGITSEKVTEWDKAASDNHTHSNKGLLDSYKQTETDLADAVSKKHSHTNASVLDGITSEKVTAWDQAATDNHTHTNKTVLDGITAEKVTAWDAAEKNAKDYADDLDEAMNERVSALEGTDHSHSNKTVLDGITSEKVTAWDAAQANVIESISVNGADATITNKKATVTIPEATTSASGVMSASDKTKLDGLATSLAGKDVTVRKKEGTTDDQCVYEILQGETVVGTINHPKELVVTGGEVITGTGADGLAKDEKYLKLTIANQTKPVYIAVKDLVDAYTAGNGITIGEDNKISLNVVDTSDISLSFNKDGQLEAKFVKAYEPITDAEIASLFSKKDE